MTDQKNTILAIVLSALVLIGWQYYFGMPQLEKQKQIQQQQQNARTCPASRHAAANDAGTGADARRHPANPRPHHPADHEPGSGACTVPARAHRDAERFRFDRAQGRAHR